MYVHKEVYWEERNRKKETKLCNSLSLRASFCKLNVLLTPLKAKYTFLLKHLCKTGLQNKEIILVILLKAAEPGHAQ